MKLPSLKFVHRKKGCGIPVPSRDANYQTLYAGNNYIIPSQGEFGKRLPAGDKKISNFFYSV